MARKKDLAGLAALAGLAYMATRDKGDKAAKGEAPSSADVASFAGTPENDSNAGMTPEAAMMEKEPAENFKSTPRSTPRPAAKAKPMGGSGRGGRGGATAEELAAYEANKPKKLQYQSLQDRARAYEEERAKSGVGMYGTEKSEPKEERMPYGRGPGLSALKMAKGGSVKGWGIARGARKAKTY